MFQYIVNFILTVAIIGITGALVVGLVITEVNDNRNKWNNGVCTECELGEYQLVTAYHQGNQGATTHYIYECDNCKSTIDVTARMR